MPAARKATPAVAASTSRIGSRRITSGRVGVDLDQVQGDQREGGRRHADQHVGPQPGGAVGRLALEADQRAEQRRADQPGDDDRQRQGEAAQELVAPASSPSRHTARGPARGSIRSAVSVRPLAARREGRAMRTMQIVELGRPLELAEVPAPVPGPGEVLLRVHACGLNFADTLMAAGRYQEKPALPFAPGLEVCGTVEALGPGVAAPAPGTRVAGLCGAGGLAELVALPAARCAPVPDGDARRGGRGLPRRLRHQPRRARLPRAAAARRDAAGASAPPAASG